MFSPRLDGGFFVQFFQISKKSLFHWRGVDTHTR